VVGNGNTACELSVNLAKVTSKLYQSYRRGRIMFSRRDDEGIPLDSQFTWPGLRLKYFLDRLIPWLTWPIADRFMRKRMISYAARSEPAQPGDTREEVLQRTEKKMRDEWRLLPCASTAHTHPAVQEDYIPALRNGTVTPVHGFKAFLGEHKILLEDDSTVEVDVVVFCTGYRMNFGIMPELEMDGACGMPLRLAGDNSSLYHERREPQLPRLYQMIFPPRYASSVAFISWIAPQESVWCVSELVAMAVAQIWAASATRDQELDDFKANLANKWRQPGVLPAERKMNAEIDAYHKWFRTAWKTNHSVRSGYVHSADTFYRFLHEAAGTGLYQKLDHILTGRGWRLWWKDHELWTWLAKGPMNSYSWRLFETNPEGLPGCGRKVWPGAREAIKTAVSIATDHNSFLDRGSNLLRCR
jgi:dimethylaniline monooxygenase (N-oxide forming)